MSTPSGAFFPKSWAIPKYNGSNFELPELSNRGTNDYSNANNSYWILSNTNLDKNGSTIIRSEPIESTKFGNGFYNDENDGLVFGCPQQYYDSKQYEWV